MDPGVRVRPMFTEPSTSDTSTRRPTPAGCSPRELREADPAPRPTPVTDPTRSWDMSGEGCWLRGLKGGGRNRIEGHFRRLELGGYPEWIGPVACRVRLDLVQPSTRIARNALGLQVPDGGVMLARHPEDVLSVRPEPWDEHEVEGPVADDLIGDVDAVAGLHLPEPRGSPRAFR